MFMGSKSASILKGWEMNFRMILGMALAMGIASNAQTVNLRGKVTDGTGKAVANAKVELVTLKHSVMTGADGSYALTFVVDALRHAPDAQSSAFAMEKSVLRLSLSVPAPVKIEVFDLQGNLVKREAMEYASAGIYSMDLAGKLPAGNLLLVKASIGGAARTFQYFPTDNVVSQMRISLENTSPAGARLTKVAATVDVLKVSATGYTTKSVDLTSLDATVDVTLGASSGDIWGGLKNAPIKSSGCGKALGTISKSGTYTISSAGGRGTYIIDIPTGYDKDTPYRLIFGNHCMGGSAARVAEAEKGSAGDDLSGFYSIKTMATKDNIPAIYVALQGNSDGTWNLPNDSKFWNDVLTLVEGNLCVDTTRVFVTGFSFGAMFSYVLSLEYPEKIRAVATYAPANYNMTQPANRQIPIAYYQTTGTTDGTCPWIHSDASQQGGKYCLLQHMKDNGCTSTATDIKLATSSTHVSTEFTGCKEGYPVKFGSFQGGHQAVHTDPGANFSWIEKEAWEFFKRF
jgi:poly(3-hydroxybutyrate) depolymerase